MKLDLRKPVFVFVGAWNPAIFQPGWIARHLFEIPEGEKVRAEAMVPTVPNQEAILYIEDIGLAVTNERVQIFVNGFDDETIQCCEQVAVQLFKTLPHTPFGSFGINFNFVEDDPGDELFDMLRTKDGIDEHFKIIGQKYASASCWLPTSF